MDIRDYRGGHRLDNRRENKKSWRMIIDQTPIERERHVSERLLHRPLNNDPTAFNKGGRGSKIGRRGRRSGWSIDKIGIADEGLD